jgi:glutamate synthase domain-containing protein 3
VRRRVKLPPPVLEDHLDWELLREARLAVEAKQPVQIDTTVRNVNRCVGGVLSSRIAQIHGADGLPPDTIQVTLRGSAGQSFGGWLAPGVSFTLHGDANDYTGKGLSGGTLAVMPPDGVTFAAEDNVIIGNTVLYGATSGRAFFRGLAGERFAVRNSGAQAVVEGVGDHGCEYMTGGRVVVLGPTGRNFAAGMSGGLAFVLDEHGAFRAKVNAAMLDQLEDLTEEDADEVRALVEEHLRRTGSPVAERVLGAWEALLPRFVKVFPTDYKRVLAEQAADASEQEIAA